MRTVDLFSGCGGMSLGFQSAGYNIVAAFENWPAAIECYKQNFKHPVIETDLSIVDEAIIRIKKYQPDLIIGGPPCQDFSNAGNRTEGERAELTHSFAKIITPMLNRKVMGRKGIGKLSLLSIAETITIYSSKNGQKNALQISTQKLREAVSQTQTYYPEEVDDSGIDFEGNGTKIVLTNLKKSRTTALAGKLKQSYIMINCWQMPKLFMQISLRKIAALHHLRH